MFDIQEELKKLPDKPGVYLMKDETGTVIYVGKARVLKNRVRQYFQSQAAHSPKVAAMVSRIAEFEYIVTDTELEAFILECNLIKELRPRYNILLKDDKNYPYIKVTINEEFPRILMTRRVEKDGARYFGPYANVFSVRETLNLIKRVFPVKTCKRVLPRDIGKGRPCLNFHIKQCLGPCTGNVSKEEYRAVIKDICSFLDGKQDTLMEKIEKEMHEAAEKLEFERAASLRDKLVALKNIAESQKVLDVSGADRDVIGFAADKTDTCVQVFFVRGGKLLGREFHIIEGMGESELQEVASSFMRQFYDNAALIPSEIIIAAELDDVEVMEEWLSSKRGGKVKILIPKRGEKLRLVEMVEENARIELNNFKDKLAGRNTAQEGLREMAGMLGLDYTPERIEAYDISNTGATDAVASMVVFENGFPAKKEYRRFRIRTAGVPNDYAGMQEVLYRRFKRALDEKAEETAGSDNGLRCREESTLREAVPAGQEEKKTKQTKFGKLPELIMVDGGLGHVNAANRVLEELNISIPVCGMVKDENHRTRGLVLPDREIDLTKNLTVLRFVTSIQDEAHRFALEYNRKLRSKRYSRSILDEIDGIGPKRKRALLKHFGSISNMKRASIDDFHAVDGISRAMAEKLYDFFRSVSAE